MENTGKISNAQALAGDMDLPHEERTRPLLMNPKTWKRLLPLAVSSAILIYLFWHIDIRLCVSALMNADMTIYVPSVIVFILATFLLDTQNLLSLIHI